MAITTNNNEIGGKITRALNAGSGVDIHDLAKTLAESEMLTTINTVTAKKEASSVSVSGFGVLKASVSAVSNSFTALKDRDQLLTKGISSQNNDRVEAVFSSEANARAGTTKFKVNALARAETNLLKRFTGSGTDTEEFTSLTQQLNGGSTINYSITVGGTTTALNNTVDTPQGLIDAVNAVTSTTGVRARALTTQASGSAFSILLEGKTGLANAFAFSGHQTANTANQISLVHERYAADLDVDVNNVENVKRSTNSPSDLIDGVQLTFKVQTETTTNIVVTENTAGLEAKLNTMIDSYNSFIQLTDYLTGEKIEGDETAGSLSGDKATVQMIEQKLRDSVRITSSTPSNGFSTLASIGIDSAVGGKISLNKTRYAAALKSNFTDIRTMLTADTNDQIAADSRVKGLAQDVINLLETVVADTGLIKTQEDAVAAEVLRYEERLLQLEERMEGIKARYLKQFAAMESLVQKSKNTGEYLTGQFKAMENMYSNK